MFDVKQSPSIPDATSATPGESGPASVPLERLEAQLCELAGHLAAATCRFLVLLGDFDARRGWADWDMNSCAAWLSWKCQMSSGRRTGCRASAVTMRPPETDIGDQSDPVGAATRRHGRHSTRVVSTGLMTTHAAPRPGSAGWRALRSVP